MEFDRNQKANIMSGDIPPHLFSIKGDTAADGPLGQNILEPSLFIGAISRNCALSSLELEYLISIVIVLIVPRIFKSER